MPDNRDNPAADPPHPGGGASKPAAADLFDRLYAELHAVAGRYLRYERDGHTLQPTALLHEVYLRLADASADWAEPAHFRALAARIMRNVLIDHAIARRAAKRGGGRQVLSLDGDVADQPADLDIEELDRALTRLAECDGRKARVVELRFFGGLTAAETATELNISLSTVEADWRMAKAWLRGELSRG